MQMELVFLGTGGVSPTPKRALSSLAVRFAGHLMIFDCGEGTQRQILSAGLGFPSSMTIFITHLHPDHTLGLGGLITTLELMRRGAPLRIYGPKGFREAVGKLLDVSAINPSFDLTITEIDEGTVMEEKEFVVEALRARHTVESFAYRIRERDRPGRMRVEYLESIGLPKGPLWGELQRGRPVEFGGRTITPEEAVEPPRKGRIVVYSGDTMPFEGMVEFAKGATVLIYDSSYDRQHRDRCSALGHSTAADAAEIARKADVNTLVLYHINPIVMYDDILLYEAKAIFQRTVLPSDLDRAVISPEGHVDFYKMMHVSRVR